MAKAITIGPGEAIRAIIVHDELIKYATNLCNIIGEFINWLKTNCVSSYEVDENFTKIAKKFNFSDEININCDFDTYNDVSAISKVYGTKIKKLRVYGEFFGNSGMELPLDLVLYQKPLIDEIKLIKKDVIKKMKEYNKIDFNEIVGKLAKYYLDNVSNKIDAKDMVLWVYEAGINDWDNYALNIKDASIENVCGLKILSIFYTDKFNKTHQYIAEVCD